MTRRGRRRRGTSSSTSHPRSPEITRDHPRSPEVFVQARDIINLGIKKLQKRLAKGGGGGKVPTSSLKRLSLSRGTSRKFDSSSYNTGAPDAAAGERGRAQPPVLSRAACAVSQAPRPTATARTRPRTAAKRLAAEVRKRFRPRHTSRSEKAGCFGSAESAAAPRPVLLRSDSSAEPLRRLPGRLRGTRTGEEGRAARAFGVRRGGEGGSRATPLSPCCRAVAPSCDARRWASASGGGGRRAAQRRAAPLH